MSVTEQLKQLKLSPNTNKMLDRILSNEGVFYRSEQRGTPELTVNEKRQLLEKLYCEDSKLFLQRYHGYLAVEDCDCFDHEDYETQFYTKLVAERCKNIGSKKSENVRLRNQRYAELERLKKETDYFSYRKMREREPLLFDKMIGRFLPEEEQLYLRPTIENESLSGVFMQFEDSQIISKRRSAQLNEWNDLFKKSRGDEISEMKLGSLAQHASSRFCEELESDDIDESEAVNDIEKASNSDCRIASSSQIEEQEMASESSEEERDQEQLKADFIDHMEQRFLRGDDMEFYDYSHSDNIVSKEYERMRDQDLEDAYFEND